MKKTSYISIVLVISIFFVACGTKSPSTTSKSNTNSTITKEFSYLPSSNSPMELLSFTPPTKDNQGYGEARYIIKNTNKNDVLQKYENILKKDGWTIYEDKKPNSIAAKKGNHQVALIPTTWESTDIQLTIVSK